MLFCACWFCINLVWITHFVIVSMSTLLITMFLLRSNIQGKLANIPKANAIDKFNAQYSSPIVIIMAVFLINALSLIPIYNNVGSISSWNNTNSWSQCYSTRSDRPSQWDADNCCVKGEIKKHICICWAWPCELKHWIKNVCNFLHCLLSIF